MEFSFSLVMAKASVGQAAAIVAYNHVTSPFGLALTPAGARALVAARDTALNDSGRVELGEGILGKLILAFCDSPFLTEQNYAETLRELVALFYTCKNECLDLVDDDQLIGEMKHYFDGSCQGSLELLGARELESLARRLRFGGSLDEERENWEMHGNPWEWGDLWDGAQ